MPGLRHVRVVLWLHLVRTGRYMTGLVNWAVIDGLWISIYVLGALMFTDPKDYPVIAPLIFWAILAWNLLSTPVWVIGNWAKFYINIGVYEEHELAGVSHNLFLSVRVIPAVMVALISAGFVAYLVHYVTGTNVLVAENLVVLVLSLVAILVISISYSLVLAYMAIITQAPAPMLDFLNFLVFIVGGVGVPVDSLPPLLRWIAAITPYSHPAELIRWASIGKEPYLGVSWEAVLTLGFVAAAVLLAYSMSRRATRYARKYGLRGIGRT